MFTKGRIYREWATDVGIIDNKELLLGLFNALRNRDDGDQIAIDAKKNNWTADKMKETLGYVDGGATVQPAASNPIFAPAPAVPVAIPAAVPQADDPANVTQAVAPVVPAAPQSAASRLSRSDEIRKRREGRTATSANQASAPKKTGGIGTWFSGFVASVKKLANRQPAAANVSSASGKKKMILISSIIAVVILLAGGGYYVYNNGNPFSGNSFNSSDELFTGDSDSANPFGDDPNVSVDPLGVQPDQLSQSEKNDQAFWSGVATQTAEERSPGNLNNQLSARTAFGLVLIIILIIEAWGEGSIRRKSQQAATYFTFTGLLAGCLTMPILVWISKATYPGWVLVGVIVIVYLWTNAASTIKSQSDLTPFLVSLAIFTTSLFYYGKFVFITTFGDLFGLTWASWVGVTTISGAIMLLMSGRAAQATLTFIIFILSIIVLVMASLEVGKKHGVWASVLISLAILITFGLLDWGLSLGVEYLVVNNGVPILVTVVLNVLVPLLAWVGSLILSIGIGVALGDTEIGRTENRQRLGLEKSGNFLQNIADFLILGTLIPLIFGVIIIF